MVLSYTVGQAEVLETAGIERGGEGDAQQAFFTRAFKLGPSTHALTLLVAETDGGGGMVGDFEQPRPGEERPQSGPAGKTFAGLNSEELTVAGFSGAVDGAAWEIVEEGNKRRILLTLPPHHEPVMFTLTLWGGRSEPGEAAIATIKKALTRERTPPDFGALTAGGPPRWEQTLTTKGTLGDASRAQATL